MAHRSMVRRSSAPVVRSPLLMFFRRRTCGHRNQIAQPRLSAKPGRRQALNLADRFTDSSPDRTAIRKSVDFPACYLTRRIIVAV